MTHHHHHEHEIKSDLSLQEKMAKLLDHWIKHNSEHADNYRNWAIRAKEENMAEVASLLEDAASLTLDISNKFEKAISEIELETEE